MKKIFILLLSCSICLSCNSSEKDNYKNVDILTGMYFFDDNASPIGKWGEPNINAGNVKLYPNPSIGKLFLESTLKITEIWIVEAKCDKSDASGITNESMQITYTTNELNNIALQKLETSNFSDFIELNLKIFSKGFYRIFYRLENGKIFWQNIYSDPTVNNIPDFKFLDGVCG